MNNFTFVIAHEQTSRWPEFVGDSYGIAITYWRRSRWQYGLRFSLLLGNGRPFVRVTTYSCPSAGQADVVKPLNCVLPAIKKVRVEHG